MPTFWWRILDGRLWRPYHIFSAFQVHDGAHTLPGLVYIQSVGVADRDRHTHAHTVKFPGSSQKKINKKSKLKGLHDFFGRVGI